MPPGFECFPDVDVRGEFEVIDSIGELAPKLTIASSTSSFSANGEALRSPGRHEGRPIHPTSSAIPFMVDQLGDLPEPVGPRYDRPGTIVIYKRAQWKFYDVEERDEYGYIYEFHWRNGRKPKSGNLILKLDEDTVSICLRRDPYYNLLQTLDFKDSYGRTWTVRKAEFQADDRKPEWHYSLVLLRGQGDSQPIWQRESELRAGHGWVQLQPYS